VSLALADEDMALQEQGAGRTRIENTNEKRAAQEPVGLRGAVARTTPIEQIAEIVPRA
jgi:hypothetical protein